MGSAYDILNGNADVVVEYLPWREDAPLHVEGNPKHVPAPGDFVSYRTAMKTAFAGASFRANSFPVKRTTYWTPIQHAEQRSFASVSSAIHYWDRARLWTRHIKGTHPSP